MGVPLKELNKRLMLRYKKALGMYPGTAHRRLLRSLLFHLLGKLNKTTCHRCGKSLTETDFTIEHTEDWRNKPNARDIYFDLNKIAFSHSSCNRQFANAGGWNRGRFTHGESGYRRRCRCAVCKDAYSHARRRKYLRRAT